MANIILDKERRLIPNWRSFGKTTALGELDAYQFKSNKPDFIVGIDDYIIDWKANKSVTFASDLLSASIVNNFTENTEVFEAAIFIIENKEKVTQSQYDLASKILRNDCFKNLEFQQVLKSTPFLKLTTLSVMSTTPMKPYNSNSAANVNAWASRYIID